LAILCGASPLVPLLSSLHTVTLETGDLIGARLPLAGLLSGYCESSLFSKVNSVENYCDRTFTCWL